MNGRLSLKAAFTATLMTATLNHQVAAQCESQWLPGDGIQGVRGDVHSMTTWDPDGEGPQPSLLIVGGVFTVAGEVMAKNVAAWNGQSWHAMGSGLFGGVNALLVQDGQLIAACGYANTSIGFVSRWNGTVWQQLGGTMNAPALALEPIPKPRFCR